MKCGSLFTGIGGLDLGLERAGLQCAWQVEIDDFCSKVLAKHWPNVRRYKDVKETHGTIAHTNQQDNTASQRPSGLSGQQRATVEIRQEAIRQENRQAGYDKPFGCTEYIKCPNCLAPVDLICGGFPCQPVSVAGQRKGEADERWLWPEFYRIICELRPKWVLVENVPGLFSVDNGRLFGGILRDLSESGYDAEWGMLSAAGVGAPHLRRRVFIVAYTNGYGCPRDMGKTSNERSTEACNTKLSSRSTNWRAIFQTLSDQDVADAERKRFPFYQGGTTHGIMDRAGVFNGNGWSSRKSEWWGVEPDVGRVAHGIPSRVDRLKSLGNAVVPQVAEVIGRWIIEADRLTI